MSAQAVVVEGALTVMLMADADGAANSSKNRVDSRSKLLQIRGAKPHFAFVGLFFLFGFFIVINFKWLLEFILVSSLMYVMLINKVAWGEKKQRGTQLSA